MQLTLKIVSYQRLTPGQQDHFNAKSNTFSIGRSANNDWVIPDPQRFLSGVHCRIHYEGDVFYITDTSTNGVFINGSSQRLQRDTSVALNNRDTIRIGDYEFEVIFNNSTTSLPPAEIESNAINQSVSNDDDLSSDPFVDLAPSPQPTSADLTFDDDLQKEINTPLAQFDNNLDVNAISIDSLMDLDELEELESESLSADRLRENHSPINDVFTPANKDSKPVPRLPLPDVHTENQCAAEAIPDNWDKSTGMLKSPERQLEAQPEDNFECSGFWDELSEEDSETEPTADITQEKPEKIKADNECTSAYTELVSSAQKPDNPPKQIPQRAESNPEAVIQNVIPPAELSATNNDSLVAFAKGANLNISHFESIDETELFEQIGRMMLEFTGGLVETLSGRTHIKSEFRLDQTMIRPIANNPFKFSTSRSSTLQQLLDSKNSAYMAGTEAIQEGFDDVNAHQMAVVAGMEAALEDILKRFKPETLEARLESDSILDNFLPGGKKAKYWDIFKLLFDQLAGEAEDDFQQLFGRKFSQAYEKQLSRLKDTHQEI
ncbi:MAG: type VI secretion system-associated FHA domain protein TagH [Xanthomonadales bacterium]|nr:type VI secretion system-associated FHA domain protein TagH [Xanthomonadales bacterium]